MHVHEMFGQTGKPTEARVDRQLPEARRLGAGAGKQGVTAKGCGFLFRGEEKCSKIDPRDSCTTL